MAASATNATAGHSPDGRRGAATPERWLRGRARPVRRLVRLGVAYGAAQAILLCAGAWLVAHVLAGAIFHGRGLPGAWPAVAGIAAIAVARGALTLLQRRASFEAGSRVITDLRAELEARLRALGPLWAARQSSGDIITRVVDGVETLLPYYAGYLPQVALSAVVPAILLLAVAPADPWSALVLAVTAPLIPVFMVLVGSAAQQASARRWTRLRRMGARFMDALSGLTTLRLYRAADRQQAALAAAGEIYRRDTMGVLRVAFLSSLVLEFFATVSIAVVAVLIGFRLLWGELGFEQGLFVLLLAPEFYLPLRTLGTRRHQRLEAASAAEDLIDLLGTPTRAGSERPAPTADTAPARPMSLTFRQVAFTYDDREVLTDVELAVAAGESLTLVGPSGSGKSTLLMLLMGFASPRHGRILVDDMNLCGLDPEEWRRRIAWVSQRAHVFHGTLRDNLLIAAPQATPAAMARALAAAALGPVVERLPAGLDTPLGERGRGLSGGEVQRLALARAWLRDAPLLLLDEPTQHLDRATAARVDTALERLSAGRTVIRVAHRVHRIPDRARVAVMRDGRIVETGEAGVLRRAEGAFAQLLSADTAP